MASIVRTSSLGHTGGKRHTHLLTKVASHISDKLLPTPAPVNDDHVRAASQPGVDELRAEAETKETVGEDDASETSSARIERLGRQRPAQFKTLWSEIAFAYSVLASQMMAVCLSVTL